jgi:hypothetical protein
MKMRTSASLMPISSFHTAFTNFIASSSFRGIS